MRECIEGNGEYNNYTVYCIVYMRTSVQAHGDSIIYAYVQTGKIPLRTSSKRAKVINSLISASVRVFPTTYL